MSTSRQLDNSHGELTFACLHVCHGERPILFAYREEEMLCTMCGQDDHVNSVDDFMVIGFDHLLQRDETLVDLGGLPSGGEIERDEIGGRWRLVEENL